MDKNQKRVLKEYPNAFIAKKDDGAYVVIDGDTFIAEEFFLPDVYTEEELTRMPKAAMGRMNSKNCCVSKNGWGRNVRFGPTLIL